MKFSIPLFKRKKQSEKVKVTLQRIGADQVEVKYENGDTRLVSDREFAEMLRDKNLIITALELHADTTDHVANTFKSMYRHYEVQRYNNKSDYGERCTVKVVYRETVDAEDEPGFVWSSATFVAVGESGKEHETAEMKMNHSKDSKVDLVELFRAVYQLKLSGCFATDEDIAVWEKSLGRDRDNQAEREPATAL